MRYNKNCDIMKKCCNKTKRNCDMMKKYCNMIKRNCDDIFGETQIYRRKGRLSWIITLKIYSKGLKDREPRDTEVRGKAATVHSASKPKAATGHPASKPKAATGHPVSKPRAATAHMASNLRVATANLKGARLTVGDRFPRKEEKREGTEGIAPTAENRALA